MKKDINLSKSNLFINTINFALVTLNKSYRPFLRETKRKYIVLQKETLNKTGEERVKARREVTSEIIEEVRQKIGSISNLVQETLANKDVAPELGSTNNTMSKKVGDYLRQKFATIDFKSFFTQNQFIVRPDGTTAISTEVYDLKEYFRKLFEFEMPIATFNEIGLGEFVLDNPNKNLTNPTLIKLVFEFVCCLIAILIGIHLSDTNVASAIRDSEIIEELDKFFSIVFPTEELVLNTPDVKELNSSAFAKHKIINILSLDETYKEKFAKILVLDEISLDERLDEIIYSGITSYKNIFDYLLNDANLEKSYVIEHITHSGITSYENIFDYLLNNANLEEADAIEYIIHSGITNYTNIFDYILSIKDIKIFKKMNYIVNSGLANYKELLEIIANYKFLTTKEKISYSLSIPNVTFDYVFPDLLSLSKSHNEIILNIIDMNLTSFTSLFNNILKIDNISNEELVTYLNYYNYCHDDTTILEEVDFVFNIERLTLEEQVDCVWNLLGNYSLLDRESFILNYFKMTENEVINLYGIPYEYLDNTQKAILGFNEKIYAEIREFILENYDFENQEQLDITIAIVAAEAWRNYIDCYAVANTIFNRITCPDYLYIGTNPYMQAIRPNQFVVYQEGKYKKFLNPTNIDDIVQAKRAEEAFCKMFYLNYEGIMHNYVGFRVWGTKSSVASECFVVRGNLYRNPMNESSRIIYDNLVNKSDEVINEEDVLTRRLLAAEKVLFETL